MSLRFEGVRKQWPGLPEPVLDHVDVELEDGTVTWLTGANGAGKTTLLRIGAGILVPDAGRVTIDDLDPERERRRYQSALGFLSTGYGGLYARMTVDQHLDWWARLALLERGERRRRAAWARESFGLAELAGRRVDRLSMGQRQRVRASMAFLHRPRAILLDEPRNSLDSAGTALLVDAVESACAEGACVLWCSPEGEEPGVDWSQSFVVGDAAVRAT